MEDIASYASMNQSMDSIVKFAEDHRELYNLKEYTVESVTKMIKTSANEVFDKKTYDSFRKCIDDIANKKHMSLNRTNIYRLCYALKIDNINLANEFLTVYLGENPLSPRVLEEFIIIAVYRLNKEQNLNLSWKEVNDITVHAKQSVGKIPPSPRVLIGGDTQNMANDIEDIVLTVEDLNEYIDSELTNSYFAKTRNTQYMAFFSYMDWESYDPSMDISSFILSTWDNDTLENRHLRTFNFENEDEDECTDYTKGDHLTSDDIEILSKVFPNAFLSYETYRHLMQRDRNEQISSETMLIFLLNDVSPYKNQSGLGIATDNWRYEIYKTSDYIDFTNEKEFIITINSLLNNAGCAHLNPNIGFDRLILDVYHDVLSDNRDAIKDGECDSEKVKSLLFSRLRSIFKRIAVEYKESNNPL